MKNDECSKEELKWPLGLAIAVSAAIIALYQFFS